MYTIFIKIFFGTFTDHSMARVNLNKSKKVLNSTTKASKYIPKRSRICINWNPSFQTQIYLAKVLLNVNIVKQGLLSKNSFWKIYEVRSLKRGISIDTDSGPLGYVLWCCGSRNHDFLLLFRLALAILWDRIILKNYFKIWIKNLNMLPLKFSNLSVKERVVVY